MVGSINMTVYEYALRSRIKSNRWTECVELSELQNQMATVIIIYVNMLERQNLKIIMYMYFSQMFMTMWWERNKVIYEKEQWQSKRKLRNGMTSNKYKKTFYKLYKNRSGFSCQIFRYLPIGKWNLVSAVLWPCLCAHATRATIMNLNKEDEKKKHTQNT